jgi:hypothetical protein
MINQEFKSLSDTKLQVTLQGPMVTFLSDTCFCTTF